MNGIFLLAKIYILASMFVGRVCYLPKLPFWQVCWLVVFVTCQNLILASMFVGRVCLFVCLFVRKFHKISRTTNGQSSPPNLVTSKH